MGFFSSLLELQKLSQGDGQVKCKSGYNCRYFKGFAEETHQCEYCGKQINPGKQFFVYLTDFEVGAWGGKKPLESVAKKMYCSVDCFRKGE